MLEIDKNYKYFEDNYDKLKKQYKNKYVIIVDEKVVFSSENIKDIVETAKNLEAGTYIIQKCEADSNNNMQVYHTRVSF